VELPPLRTGTTGGEPSYTSGQKGGKKHLRGFRRGKDPLGAGTVSGDLCTHAGPEKKGGEGNTTSQEKVRPGRPSSEKLTEGRGITREA